MTRLRPRQLSDLPKLDQSGQRYFPMSKDVGDVIDRIDCLNESWLGKQSCSGLAHLTRHHERRSSSTICGRKTVRVQLSQTVARAREVYSDGSVIGTIQVRARDRCDFGLPPGTLKVKGDAVCATLKGLSFELCFNRNRTGEQGFRGHSQGWVASRIAILSGA